MRGPPNVRGSVFRGSGQNFTIEQSPEVLANFQEFALKLSKYEYLWINFQKNSKTFTDILHFCASFVEKRIITYI